MRKKISLGVVISLFGLLVIAPAKTYTSKGVGSSGITASHPQNVPPQKPKYDYMSTILSRTTPLGLKIGPELENFLQQPSTKWAIRVGAKHVLN